MEIDDCTMYIFVFFMIQFPCVLSQSWLWTLYPQLTTWNDAARFCNDNGGRLLKVDSSQKYNMLQDLSREFPEWGNPIWLGLYYDTNSGKRFWQGQCDDGVYTTAYSNWDSSDRSDDSKPCTMMDAGSFTWKPEVCKQEYAVLCEAPTDSASACGHYNEMVDGVQLCVLVEADPSTTPPTNYQSIEGVVTPPCYGASGVENPAHTTTSILTSHSVTEEASTTIRSSTQKVTTSSTERSTQNSPIQSEGFTTTMRKVTSPQFFETSVARQSSGPSTAIITGQSLSTTSESSTERSFTSNLELVTSSTAMQNATSRRTGYTVEDTTIQMSSFLYSTTKESYMPSLCPCQCSDNVNITYDELAKKLQELQNILKIDKKETLKSRLKLVSVQDERTSSTAIGVFGIIIISVLILFIVFLDVLRFFIICH